MSGPTRGQGQPGPDTRRYESFESEIPSSSDHVDDSVFTPDELVHTPPSLQSVPSEAIPTESTDRIFPVKSIVRVNSGTEVEHTTLDLVQPSESASYFPTSHSSHPGSPLALKRGLSTRDSSGSSPASSLPSNSRNRTNTLNSVVDAIAGLSVDSPLQAPSSTGFDGPSPIDSVQGDELLAEGQNVGAASGNGLGLVRGPTSTDHLPESTLMTTRFTHKVTEEGHAIITGRDEAPVRCEDEPIHTPGAVQGFGMLIALKEEEPGRFVVRLASENSERFIGHTPAQLFALHSIMDTLTEEQQENLQTHIDSVKEDDDTLSLSGPEIFNTSIKNRDGKRVKLWCAVHINPNRPELIVCEFEREDDPQYPLIPHNASSPNSSSASTQPTQPANTLMAMPTDDGVVKTTQVTSRPLRVSYKTRVGKSTSNPMQIFDLLGQIQDQLAEATNTDDLLRTLVGVVKELTSYHRVMVYQFDASYNGKVVTELVDAGHTGDLYFGLQFPASDIPAQARELYKVNKMRLLYDRDLETARLVCRSQADLDTPLDMTHCYLRAMSPIHLKYLANMQVRASMSLSLKVFGDLWGLVSCHGFGSEGMRPPFPIRKMCKLVSNVASRNLERLSYESSLQAQKIINSRLVNTKNGSGHLVASEDELLEMFEADFGVISILGETKALGRHSQSQEALAMLEYLRVKKPSEVVSSHDITSDFPDLEYAPGFSLLGGMLYVPLSSDGESFIVLFRKAQAQEVKWGGNPYENKHDGSRGPLEPRKSFKTWLEVVTGRSREWTTDQIELATVLCTVYGKFIQVWRQKEPSSHNSRLQKLLLANSAHQVRTPLNAIINYLEVALEGSLDQETRDNLAESHSASKSLIYVINDLLDLTKTEEGHALARDEVFDLPATISHATSSFQGDAKRKHLNFDVEMHSELPRKVCGDRVQVRQAISNIIANAFQYTSDGFVHVTSYVADADDGGVRIEIAVQDSGVGMTPEDQDRLFHDLEQISDIGDEDKPDGAEDGKKLGLGLAVVARIVRNMDGLLRVNSEPGQGSCFVLQLPFELPEGSERSCKSRDAASTTSKDALSAEQPSILTRTQSYSSADVTLVPRASSLNPASTRGTENGSQAGGSQAGGSQWRAGSVGEPEDREGRVEELHPSDPAVRAEEDVQKPKVSPPEPIAEEVKEEVSSATSVAAAAGPKVVVNTDASESSDKPVQLQILIAEDDPVNVMFLRKRLQKLGHNVHHSLNGEDCATVYRNQSNSFDVILMDMQMPIMDGISSTKAIRAWERDPSCLGLSPLAQRNGQIPIFAVSASLVEEHRNVYADAGFDGWIPKPINFNRLREIVAGVSNEEAKSNCVYTPGNWECGGWFEKPKTE